MTTPNGEGQDKPQTVEERISALEDAIETILDVVEAQGKKLAEVDKKVPKASKGLFGGKRKSEFGTKDTVTGIVYPTKAAVGKALASEFGLDPLVSTVYYTIAAKAPERFVDATEAETTKSRDDAKAKRDKEVEAANLRLAAEEKTKKDAEAKAKAEAEAKANKK